MTAILHKDGGGGTPAADGNPATPGQMRSNIRS